MTRNARRCTSPRTTGTSSLRATLRGAVYDFFWMLHTMDYAGRDNFNNPLIITIGMAALWLSISGVRAADAELRSARVILKSIVAVSVGAASARCCAGC